jgi:hypothetical protein
MKDVTTGTDTRAPRPIHRSLLTFDLDQELERLTAEPAWAEHGRTAKTLAKTPTFRVVLMQLRAGGSIGDDDVWAPLTVQVLQGRVRSTRGDATVDLGRGGLTWFEDGPGWEVTAIDDSVLLLSVTWPPERAVEPAFV